MTEEQREAIEWAIKRLERGIGAARISVAKNKEGLLFNHPWQKKEEFERRMNVSIQTIVELANRKKVFEDMLNEE